MSESQLTTFYGAGHAAALATGRQLAQTYDLCRFRSLLDVAGGSGGLAIEACQRCPALRATVIDLPTVTPITQRFVDEARMGGRVQVSSLDVVENAPQGQYDVAQFDNTFLAPYGAAGTMMPLDNYIAGSEEYDIADFEQGQQDYGKYDGKTLGLTLSTEPMIQWYRTDIYESLGLKPAKTWEEYRANAEAVKKRRPTKPPSTGCWTMHPKKTSSGSTGGKRPE